MSADTNDCPHSTATPTRLPHPLFYFVAACHRIRHTRQQQAENQCLMREQYFRYSEPAVAGFSDHDRTPCDSFYDTLSSGWLTSFANHSSQKPGLKTPARSLRSLAARLLVPPHSTTTVHTPPQPIRSARFAHGSLCSPFAWRPSLRSRRSPLARELRADKRRLLTALRAVRTASGTAVPSRSAQPRADRC